MGALYFFVVLAACSLEVRTAQFFCVGVDCKNVTLYLGPRFGSKTIQLSPLETNITSPVNITYGANVRTNSSADFWRNLGRNTNEREISRRGTTAAPRRWAPSKISLPGMPRVVYGTYRPLTPRNKPSLDNGTPVGPLTPRVRPVLQDGSQSVDLTGDDIILHDADLARPRDNTFSKDLLNLTSRGFSGEDVKGTLASINSTNLTSTTRLLLNNNLISFFPTLTFPVELEYSLNQLWMDGNPLHYLSPTTRFEISRLNTLKLLSLSNTNLTYLSSISLPQLEILYLNNNLLTEIPQGFDNLRQLHLYNNLISSVAPENIASFTNLRLLDLSANKISFVFDHPFMSLRRLETLYLNDNKLTDARDVDIPHNAAMFLARNPLVCGCPLAQLVNEPWSKVADKCSVKCTDDNGKSYQPVTSVGLTPCRDPWRWWYMAGEKIELCFRWLHNIGITWHNICNLLYWALLITALYAVIKVIRPKNFKVTPSEVPYNILDDKNDLVDDRVGGEKPVVEMNEKISVVDKNNA